MSKEDDRRARRTAAKFDNDTLLKLRRKYSQDEEFAFMDRLLRESQTKNGELTSERDELQHELKEMTKKYNVLKSQFDSQQLTPEERLEIKKAARIDERVMQLTARNKELDTQNKKLTKDNKDLVHKNIMLTKHNTQDV